MLRIAGRRTCALGVVLALLSAPLLNAPAAAPGCHQCPSGCPMHARRGPGCHHAKGPRCHEAAGVALRTTCRHHADDGVPAPAFRGVVRPVAATKTAVLIVGLPASLPVVRDALSPEPPTHPPRASFVRG